MKIFNLIKNIFKSEPKIECQQSRLKFPALKNGEFVLLRADINTGIVLDEEFKYALNDLQIVYTKFDDLDLALNNGKKLIEDNPSIEFVIYDENQEVVYHSNAMEKKFHSDPEQNEHIEKQDNLTYSEFNSLLKKQVDSLPEDKLLEFALNICKRLLPEYVNFHNKHHWGDTAALTEAIHYCESHKIIEMQEDILKSYLDRVDLVTPDTEDFGDLDGSYALNAGASVLCLLEFLTHKETSHILDVSTYMTDTIDFKLKEINPHLTDEEMDLHPDMIKERKYQLELTKE